jgi:hypothetical protein
MRRALPVPAFFAAAALLATAAPAHADGTSPATPERSRSQNNQPTAWWVDTRPWTCASWTSALAHQIQLACDAGAPCAIASDERAASRCATLVCGSDDRWTLEAHDRSGRILWSLALQGSPEDRLRQAGVWVARSEMSELPPLPPDSATAPAPTPAPPETTQPPALGATAPDQPASASVSPRADHPSEGWLAFSASGRVGEMRLYDFSAYDTTVIGVTGGVQAAAVARFGGAYGGLSMAFDQSLSDLGGTNASVWRPGVVLGWGAPYGEGWAGLSAAGGGAISRLYGGGYARDEEQFFAEVAAHLKMPRLLGQQPFVSASGAWITGGSMWSSKSLIGLDLGLVWND